MINFFISRVLIIIFCIFFSDLKIELINKLDKEEKKDADGNVIVDSGGQEMPEIPFKVAKALDPNIYRNTELDVWHELTRGMKRN